MNFKGKTVLILAPHTDDAEFGCGGTISKLIEEGNNVYCVAFSACELSLQTHFPKDILITEIKEAAQELSIPPENLILYNYEVRTFNYKRQEILQDLINLRSKLNPDIVFIPSLHDIHQDHHTIAQEGLRAFKNATIFCYEVPWNNLNFNTSAFFVLSQRHLQKKFNALAKYQSQAHRPYANVDFLRSLARVRGTQINVEFAECFEVLRLII
ncbi:MAG: PIG-L deacetylase family protein [Bacteroidota bacterium]